MLEPGRCRRGTKFKMHAVDPRLVECRLPGRTLRGRRAGARLLSSGRADCEARPFHPSTPLQGHRSKHGLRRRSRRVPGRLLVCMDASLVTRCDNAHCAHPAECLLRHRSSAMLRGFTGRASCVQTHLHASNKERGSGVACWRQRPIAGCCHLCRGGFLPGSR
jgi:hypothetical protein